jgi:hypothetical protein
MSSGPEKSFIVRISERKAKQYSKRRVLEKLVLGELSPQHEVMGEDGQWRALGQTPGFRKFCSNLKSAPPKPSTGTNSGPNSLDIGKILGNPTGSPKDSVWDGFQLDEQDGVPTSRGRQSNPGSSGETPILELPSGFAGGTREVPSRVPPPNKHRTDQTQPPSKVPESKKANSPPPQNSLASLLPPTETEDDSQGYGVLVERESKVSRSMRKKVTSAYAPKPKKEAGIWVERGMKLAFLFTFLAVAYFAGPALLEKARTFWDKAVETKPAPPGTNRTTTNDSQGMPAKPPPGTPPLRK